MFTCMLLFCEKLSAQSMQETTEWLRQTFAEIKIRQGDDYADYSFSVMKDSVNKEMLLKIYIVVVIDSSHTTKAIQIPLKKVYVFADTLQYDDKCIYLGFKVKNEEKRISVIKIKDEHVYASCANEYYLPILYSQDNMIRIKKMVKAIQHLIKLVGGTVPNKNTF